MRRAAAVLRWVLTALAGVALLMWIASGWMYGAWRSTSSDSIAFVLKGRAEVYISPRPAPGFKVLGPPPSGLSAGRVSRLWMWDQSWQLVPRLRVGNFGVHAVAPLWLPLLVLGIPSALLWRSRVVRLKTNCRFCDYDLRGLAAGAPCPECGKAR